MKKLFACLVAGSMLLAFLAGCGAAPSASTSTEVSVTASETPKPSAEPEEQELILKIGSLKGPTSIGLVKEMEQEKENVSFTMAGAADEIVAALGKGDLNAAAIPANLAATLWNKLSGKYQVVAINTLGVLYMLDTDDSIHSVADLKGRTVVTTGKGTTPEYALNYILKKNGLTPGTDVTVEFKSEAAEVAAELTAGTDMVAMLPQPYVATVLAQNEAVRVALDMTEEWDKVSEGSALVTGVLIMDKSLMESSPKAVESFLEDYRASVAYTESNLDDTAALCEKFGIIAKAAVAKQAIPQCNIVLITGDEMQEKLSGYLQALYDEDPKAVGGTMPDETFYYLGGKTE